MNKGILMGRITKDPELKKTPSDVAVTSFTLAVERGYPDKKTGKRATDFINIVAWRTLAEFVCKKFKKGSLIALEGSIQTRSYEDKDGNKRTAFEIVAENVYFTGERTDSDSKTAPKHEEKKVKSSFEDEYEDIVTEDDDLPY